VLLSALWLATYGNGTGSAVSPYNGMAVREDRSLEPDGCYSIDYGGCCVLFVGWRARIDLYASCVKHQVLREIRDMFAKEWASLRR
jgi:hypothetical protein